MNKRQISARETRKNLVKTALRLFKEKGFYAINVEDITKAANVSKGTFYTYFKRKEDIVLEITRGPFNEISDELRAMVNESLIKRLTHYFHRFMECVEVVGIHVCRQWVRDVLDPNNVPDDKDSKKWFYDFDMLKSILDEAVEKAELKPEAPTELLSHLLICELYGMMTCWCMSDGRFEPLEWTDKFCGLQLKAVLNDYLT